MAKNQLEVRECKLEVVDTLPDGTKLYLVDEATLESMIEAIINKYIDPTRLPVLLNSVQDANNLQNGQLGFFN